MQATGMTKLIRSGAFDSTVDVGMRLIEDPALLTKSAANVFGCEYEDIQPDEKHLGIHLVALGDFEHYGANRNGDSFPKVACQQYHKTFVKHGNVYRHHRNKDPEKRLGQVVKSAFNEPMGRIELFIHAHKDKARDELQKLASDGELPFSMACRVAFDRCSVCNTLRKSSKDPNQCSHIAEQLGKVAEDGHVICTHNDQPRFFDISFVTRPADRIAWHLKAASGETIDSVKLAEAEGIWVPDDLMIVSPLAQAKLECVQKLAEMEDLYVGLVKQSSSKTPTQRYFWELRKAAGTSLDDEVITKLRKYEPDSVFYALAKVGVVLNPDSFFKYAMGLDYGEIAPLMVDTRKAIRTVYSKMAKEGSCQEVCNTTTFDVDANYLPPLGSELQKVARELAEVSTFVGPEMEQRVIAATIRNENLDFPVDISSGIEFNGSNVADVLARKYAAYKVSAINAVIDLHTNTDTEALTAVSVAQNLIGK